MRATGTAAAGVGVGEEILSAVPLSPGSTVKVTEAQELRFIAGRRSDPFFADQDGFVNNFQWTGRDHFIDHDVFCIALEIANSAFGGTKGIAAWARTVGISTQHVLNQAGRPGNNVFRPKPEVFQTVPPAQQRDRYLSRYVQSFLGMGYPEPDAARLAMEWVPDVLSFDPAQPSGFPNGRLLTDDVVANAVEILTRALLPASARIPAHSDLLAQFPYLGPPHRG